MSLHHSASRNSGVAFIGATRLQITMINSGQNVNINHLNVLENDQEQLENVAESIFIKRKKMTLSVFLGFVDFLSKGNPLSVCCGAATTQKGNPAGLLDEESKHRM